MLIMGMYDTFYGEIKCPICGKTHKIEEQTKSYDCALDEFLLGDYIDKGNANYIYPIDCFCETKEDHPMFHVGAIIRKGQLVKYVTGKELENADARDYDNIEDGYQRIIDYERDCAEAEGMPHEDFDFSKTPLVNGYKFIAFNVEWVVKGLYMKTSDIFNHIINFYIINSKEHGERILEIGQQYQEYSRIYKLETLKKEMELYPNLYQVMK